MADIRFKDLTTTASSTASDDFIAVDGTTNGTRKLSAYSPSFGGNATVGGTLSITGQANFAGGTTFKWATDGDVYGRQFFSGANGTDGVKITQASGTGIIASIGNGGLSFRDDANTQLMNLADSTGVVSIPSTSASTTTSSGALVVGNGTQGGLGVGGAANIGGALTVSSVLNAAGDDKLAISWNGSVDSYYLGANYLNTNGTETVTNSSRGSWRQTMRTATSIAMNWDWRAGSAGAGTFTNLMSLSSGGVLSVLGTTPSTTTSSGALVVSGGVGVAGAVNAGTFYGLVDGVTAPATESGYARIYVDSADGDLKVKFGDGTVKTIATDS